MNAVLETIKNRRSVRQYQPEQIPDADLQLILEAAIAAPSAQNQQKWHFSIIQNKELIQKMVAVMKENLRNCGIEFLARKVLDPNFHPYHNAPTVIYVTADEKARFTTIDASLAAQNILLAAESLNISSSIMTSSEKLFDSPQGLALKKEMGIPEGYAHVCCITLGYNAGPRPEAKPRNKAALNIIK